LDKAIYDVCCLVAKANIEELFLPKWLPSMGGKSGKWVKGEKAES